MAGFAAWFAWPPPHPVNRWNISLPESAPIAPIGSAPLAVGRPALAISPDGSKIVYVADIGGTTQLYLRSLEQFEVMPIPGTEGAYYPFFAPDGQWVGFFAGNELKKISLAGGAPVSLCSVPNCNGATWGAADKIVFSSKNGSKLWWISASGGAPHLITDERGSYMWPESLPDGDAVIVNDYSTKLFLVSMASGKKKELGIAGSNARYVANDYLVYNREGRLEAIGFDAETQVVTGTPAPVLDGIRIEAGLWAAQCAISRNGTLVYLPGVFEEISNLVWLDRRGHIERLPYPAEIYNHFRLSPDGQRLAISIYQGDKRNIWIYNLKRQSRFKLTLEGDNISTVWSPDGKSIAFASDRAGKWAIFVKSADRKGEAKLVHDESEKDLFAGPNSWSPDGKVLLFEDGQDIWSLQMDSTGTIKRLINSPFEEGGAAFSPDGHWVAYTSDEQGQADVYVQPYPPTGESVIVSTEGGEEPVWSQSSKELFYRNGRQWMVASFTTSPILSFEVPRLLFEGNYLNIAGMEYDVSPDGQRFLLLKPIEESSPRTQLNVVTNWFEELKRKVPGGKP